MSELHKRALQYVKNTGGGATLQNFVDDHYPIGRALWTHLWDAKLVAIDTDMKIFLSPEGEQELSK